MPRPATVFSFATNTLNNGTFSTPNKKPLSPTKLQDGFLVETLHRGELNTLFHDIGEWITHFADDLNGQKIEFGTTKTEIPVIDGDIISTRANVVKQVIGNSSTKVINNLEVVANNGATNFSVDKETGAITAPSITGSASSWKTARKLTLSGGVTGNVDIDGSGDATLSTTLSNLSGAKITSGTVAAARVGVLPASKITSGSFDVDRIPSLNASKINAGTLDVARLPSATPTTKGIIQKATTAEMTAGVTDKFPDAATVKTYVGDSIGTIQRIPYAITAATYTNRYVGILAQAVTPSGLAISSDGLTMFVANSNAVVSEFSLSEAFNVNTATYTGISRDISTNIWDFGSMVISEDGLNLYAARSSTTSSRVFRYSMSTPNDLSTLSDANDTLTIPETGRAEGLDISSDGTSLFYANDTSEDMTQLNLTTPYQLDGGFTVIGSTPAPVGVGTILDISISDDGMTLLLADTSLGVSKYTMSEAFNLGTASPIGATALFSPNGEDSDMISFAVSRNGMNMYFAGKDNDRVYQYSLGYLTSN